MKWTREHWDPYLYLEECSGKHLTRRVWSSSWQRGQERKPHSCRCSGQKQHRRGAGIDTPFDGGATPASYLVMAMGLVAVMKKN
jgi:hypothetical protein